MFEILPNEIVNLIGTYCDHITLGSILLTNRALSKIQIDPKIFLEYVKDTKIFNTFSSEFVRDMNVISDEDEIDIDEHLIHVDILKRKRIEIFVSVCKFILHHDNFLLKQIILNESYGSKSQLSNTIFCMLSITNEMFDESNKLIPQKQSIDNLRYSSHNKMFQCKITFRNSLRINLFESISKLIKCIKLSDMFDIYFTNEKFDFVKASFKFGMNYDDFFMT